MKRVGLIVGHMGRGTGCASQFRDEWEEARQDAELLYMLLQQNGELQPLFFSINRNDMPWKLLGSLLSSKSSIMIKANWAKLMKLDCLIEFHYNSAEQQTASGHEVIGICGEPQFADRMVDALDELPNKKRALLPGAGLLLNYWMKDSGIPTVIIEPAFIWEPNVGSADFRNQLCKALQWGIEEFFGLDHRGVEQ